MARLDGYQAELYNAAGMDNEYTILAGVFVIPLAEAVPTDAVELSTWKPFVAVQAHAPIRLRAYSYAAKKERNPPVLPTPGDSGAYTFLGGSVGLPHPTVRPDGSYLWSVSASYLFAEGAASTSESGFVVGGLFNPFRSQLEGPGAASVSDAPAPIREGGVGPKVGWNLAKGIDLNSPYWTYPEPSYFPAQMFSEDMVCGAGEYPPITTVSGDTRFPPPPSPGTGPQPITEPPPMGV